MTSNQVKEITLDIEIIEYLSKKVTSLKEFDIVMRKLLIESLTEKGMSDDKIAAKLDCSLNMISKIRKYPFDPKPKIDCSICKRPIHVIGGYKIDEHGFKNMICNYCIVRVELRKF